MEKGRIRDTQPGEAQVYIDNKNVIKEDIFVSIKEKNKKVSLLERLISLFR